MRGVSKSSPPVDVHPDGHATASLGEAEEAYLARLDGASNPVSFARSAFDRLEKRKLRAGMYGEQRSLCVYCERRIAEGHPAPRIDHWYPLSREPERALRWNNLYLSCPTPETCDSAKGDHPFRWGDGADMPWPAEFAYEDAVGFTSRGEIYVRSDVALSDPTRRAVELAIEGAAEGGDDRRGAVNLNDPALVKARVAAVQAELERLERVPTSTTKSADRRDERAAGLLGRNPLPEFVSIRVAGLRRTLGRGR